MLRVGSRCLHKNADQRASQGCNRDLARAPASLDEATRQPSVDDPLNMTTLHQVKAKLDQATNHAAVLGEDIQVWQTDHLHSVIAQPVLDTGSDRYEFRVVEVPAMPALAWGAAIGDVLHNLRSALDYLAWHAATDGGRTTPPRPRLVSFPVTDSDASYQRSEATKQLVDDFVGFFRQFQPFIPWPGPDRYVAEYVHPLRVLQKLSNNDKHRLVTPVLGRQGAIAIPPSIPTGAVAAGGTNEPIVPGAVIFRLRRALAVDPPPVRVSPFVAFENLEGIDHGLQRLRGAAEHVYQVAVDSSLFG